MPTNPGDILPPYNPVIPGTGTPVYRPVYSMIQCNQYLNGNTAPNGSLAYPGPDSNPAQRLGRFKQSREMPVVGSPCFFQTNYAPGTFLVNETYAGLPPLHAYDAGDSTVGNSYAPADGAIPTSGYPYWWTTLHNEGYKRNGPAILLEYPGGPEAYFTRFIDEHLCQSLAFSIDPDVMISEPVFGYDGYVVPAPTRQKMREYTGLIVANVEAFWPYSRSHMYTHKYAGAYLAIFREVMRRLNGSYPSDATLMSTYWDIAWKRLVIPYLKKIKEYCPRALVGIYNLPISSAEPLVAPYNNYWLELQSEEQSGVMDELWRTLDFLAPSLSYVHTPIVSDNVVPPAGHYKYSYYIFLNSGSIDRTVQLRYYCGKPVYVFARTTLPTSVASRNGSALTQVEAQCTVDIIDRSNPDGVILWEAPGGVPFPASCLTIEDQLNEIQTGYSRFSQYYEAIARTPRN